MIKILRFAKNVGRVALATGGVGTAATLGTGEIIEIVAQLTLLVGAVTEGLVRVIHAWAVANGKIAADVKL